MNDNRNQISKNLELIRYYNKYDKYYSQTELSKILRISQTQISRIESGNFPKLTDIISYAVFFKVSIDDLVFKKYDRNTKKFIEE